MAWAIPGYAEQLPLEAGEEPPDYHTLTHSDHLSEAVYTHIGSSTQENRHILQARAFAVTGLFKLFEAERLWADSWAEAVEELIGAGALERDAAHARDLVFVTKREEEMSAVISTSKSKSKKGADEKNAKYKAWRAQFIDAYEEHKKSLMTKQSMSKAADAVLEKVPHIEVDDRIAYEWIREHEAAKKPKKMTEHL